MPTCARNEMARSLFRGRCQPVKCLAFRAPTSRLPEPARGVSNRSSRRREYRDGSPRSTRTQRSMDGSSRYPGANTFRLPDRFSTASFIMSFCMPRIRLPSSTHAAIATRIAVNSIRLRRRWRHRLRQLSCSSSFSGTDQAPTRNASTGASVRIRSAGISAASCVASSISNGASSIASTLSGG